MCSVKNSDSQDKNGKIQKKGTDVTSNRPRMVLWPTGLLNLLPGQVPVWKHTTAKLYSLKLSSLSVIGVFWYLSAFDCCTAILIWNCDMWFLTIKEYSLKEFHSVFFSSTLQLLASSLFIVYVVAEFSLKYLALE